MSLEIKTQKKEKTVVWEGDGMRPEDNLRSYTYEAEYVTAITGAGDLQDYADTLVGREMSAKDVSLAIEHEGFVRYWQAWIAGHKAPCPGHGVPEQCALVPGKDWAYVVCDPEPRIVDDLGNHLTLIGLAYRPRDLRDLTDEALEYME